jgi:hypothetical protein
MIYSLEILGDTIIEGLIIDEDRVAVVDETSVFAGCDEAPGKRDAAGDGEGDAADA